MIDLARVPAAALGVPGDASWRLDGCLPPAPRLAVVGSRAAHRAALECIPAIVRAASERGHALVSGGARGVDAAVHRAALAAGTPQLAIVPCHPHAPYPPEHAPLFAAIARAPGSGVLFSLADGVHNTRGVFASRNALVVAAASAVLVAQAASRSGSWGTGRLALRKRVRTAAMLGSPGCADLLVHGAAALATDPANIGAELRAWLSADASSEPTWPPELLWLADLLARAGPRGVTLDDLPDPTTGCTALLSAELLGLVVESPPGRYHPRGGP